MLLTRRLAQRGSAVSLGSGESCRALSPSPFFLSCFLFGRFGSRGGVEEVLEAQPVPGSAEHFTTVTPSTASPIAAPVSGGLKHRGEEIALGTGTEIWVQQLGSTLTAKYPTGKEFFQQKWPGSPLLHGTSPPCRQAHERRVFVGGARRTFSPRPREGRERS